MKEKYRKGDKIEIDGKTYTIESKENPTTWLVIDRDGNKYYLHFSPDTGELLFVTRK